MLHRRLLVDDGRGVAEALNEEVCIPSGCSGLTELADGKVLLRLAHLYEVGEDKNLSVVTSVELKMLFPDKKIREPSLTANQKREDMEKKRLKWKTSSSDKAENVIRGGHVDPSELVVQLAPMEIRTFIIELDKKGAADSMRRGIIEHLVSVTSDISSI